MRIADDGNVGIGYNNPYKKLHLHNPTDSGTPDCQMNFTTGVTEAGDGNGFRVGWNGTVANMYLFENADMRFATNNSERMRIKADGKVGIGTTSPAHKLDINGGAIFLDSDWPLYLGSANAFIEGNSSGTIVRINASAGFKVTDGGDTRLLIDTNGKVGIGTGSPYDKLEVVGDIRITNANGSNPTDAGSLIFNESGTTWATNIYGFRINMQGSSNYLNFQSANNTTVKDILTLTRDTARVGIGTTTPQVKIDVDLGGNDGMNASFAGTIASGEYQGIHFGYSENANSNYRKSGLVFERQDSAARGKIHILNNAQNGSNSATLSDSRVTIQYDGNVGIGTTSPAEKLEVNGSIKLGSMKLENISAGGRIGFNRNTSNGAIYNSSYEAFQIQSNGAGYLETQVYNSSGGYIGSMVLTDDVKLGIGTTSPTYKLSVAGAISGAGFVTYTKSYGSLNATGNAVAGITAAANGNGSSCGFTFTCFGHTGAYQRIVYSCYNGSGTWYAKKVIDEGTNQLDVAASANGSTITFTFKATSSTMSYTPRVKVEAEGHNINSTYA